jgi:uncharacterized protein (TIGR01777 family)
LRVAILGASGFIGSHLTGALKARGDEVVVSSLRDPQAAAYAVAGADAVVNLAGENLGQRWTAQTKRAILESRTTAPAQFFDALRAVENKPRVYVSASAVGYYGTSEVATFTEESPPGSDFLAKVCVEWERVARRGAEYGMRVATLRAGLVLARDGGALARLLPLFKAGTGGRVGSGRQWYSWIHIDDVIALYLLAIDRIEGALNATAPQPVRNEEFTAALGRALHRPTAIPAPPFMLKLMLGEGATIVLDGQRVLPQRAQAEGYVFKFPTLDEALADIID